MHHATHPATILAAIATLLFAAAVQAQTAPARPAKAKAPAAAKPADADIPPPPAPTPPPRNPAQDIFSQAFKLFQEGDYGVARATFERGLALDPDNGLARFYLAETLLRMKDYATAWEQYNRALSRLPDTAPERAKIDKAIAEIGADKGARAQLQTLAAQKVLPSGLTLHDWIVAAKPRAEKPDDAFAVIGEATEHLRRFGPFPDLIAIRDGAVHLLVKSIPLANEDQARAAIPRLESLRALAGNSLGLRLALGKAQHLLGDFDRAREAYSAALQAMKPDAPQRKSVVAALGQIERREKPAAGPQPPVALGTLRDCPECPEMVMISEGAFEMGATGIAEPVRLVRVPSFALAKTEVTQAQWRTVMGSNPSHFKNCDDCPVEQVSWDDAQDYLRKLSARTGKHYRLPSEAEWEYACRAGENHEYCGGNNLGEVGWYGAYADPPGNSPKNTNPVARKRPNALGLYDMSGNVWEWVEDCWHDNYTGAPEDGSAWTNACAGEVRRVLRGGSWNEFPQSSRAASRIWNEPANRYSSIGFRPARMLP